MNPLYPFRHLFYTASLTLRSQNQRNSCSVCLGMLVCLVGARHLIQDVKHGPNTNDAVSLPYPLCGEVDIKHLIVLLMFLKMKEKSDQRFNSSLSSLIPKQRGSAHPPL